MPFTFTFRMHFANYRFSVWIVASMTTMENWSLFWLALYDWPYARLNKFSVPSVYTLAQCSRGMSRCMKSAISMCTRRLSKRWRQLKQVEKRYEREHTSPLLSSRLRTLRSHNFLMNDKSHAMRSLTNELCLVFFSTIFRKEKMQFSYNDSFAANHISYVFSVCWLDGRNQRETIFGSGWRRCNVNKQSHRCGNRSSRYGLRI